MQQKYQYTSADRIFAKLVREGISNFDEGDVIEYIGEALEFIGAVPYYEEAISFMEVKDHQCELPNGIHQIVQLARNLCWKKDSEDNLCAASVIQELCEIPGSSSNGGEICPPNPAPIPLNCEGMPMTEYDVAYYRPYFDLQSEYYLWSNTGTYRNCFTPIRLATSNFFMARGDDAERTVYRHGCGVDEYTVINKEVLRFSFKEGHVALSHTRQKVDDVTGYPLIPDHTSYTTAIVSYIAYKIAQKEFRAGREGSKGRKDDAEKDWNWYCKQARNMDLMPYGIDEHQNLYDQRTRLLPNDRQYYSFFGKMARPEYRKWDDPDLRNYSVSYFRGVGRNNNY